MNFYKDSILLVIGFALKLVFALLTDRIIAIHVVPDLYGMYKYSITIITILGTLSNLGFSSSIVRTVTLYQNNHKHLQKIIVTSSVFILLISGFLTLLFSSAFIQSLIKLESKEVFSIIILGVIGFSFNQFFIGIYSSYKETRIKVTINDILQPILLFLFIYLFSTRLNITIKHVSLIYIGVLYFILFINSHFVARVLKKNIGGLRKFRFRGGAPLRDYYKYSLPILVTTFIIALSANIDKLVLAQIVNKTQIGIYFSAFTLSSILGFILNSLLFLFLPIASNYYTQRKYELGSKVSSYISKWLMLVSFIPFWFLFHYSYEVIFYFYGTQYVSGNETLKILALAGYINVSVGFTGQNLLALGDSYNQMKIRITGFIIGLILAFVLGKYYGILGVAISVLITLLVTNIYQLLIAFFKHKVVLLQKVNLLVLLFTLATVLCLIFRHKIIQIDLFLLDFVLDIMIYLILILSFRIVNARDKRVVKLINLGQ